MPLGGFFIAYSDDIPAFIPTNQAGIKKIKNETGLRVVFGGHLWPDFFTKDEWLV